MRDRRRVWKTLLALMCVALRAAPCSALPGPGDLPSFSCAAVDTLAAPRPAAPSKAAAAEVHASVAQPSLLLARPDPTGGASRRPSTLKSFHDRSSISPRSPPSLLS